MEGRSFTELIPEILIAIDHGWSSIKTPSIIFENGITELQTMPATKDNLLEFRGRKYVIGQGRMGKQETKTENESYYLLTLAAIAKELRKRTGAKVVKVNLAVGVPLTLYGKEKKEFKNYLRANDKVSFYYEGDRYVVHFGKVRVFAQCHAAIANRMEGMDRLTAVDCGSWTLDIMSVVNKVPVLDECHTYQQGLITAIVAGFLLSFFGGSNFLIGGPTGAFIVIVAGIVSQYGMQGLIIATIMAGVFLVVMGLCKMGAIFKFIPYPIVVGFTSGIALTIFSTQMKDFFGYPLDLQVLLFPEYLLNQLD